MWLLSGTRVGDHTLGQWWRGVCWTFLFPFPTHYPTITEFLFGLHRSRRSAIWPENKVHRQPNKAKLRELHSFLPPFRLANPFPRRPYPYSFQSNAVYCKPDMILASLLIVVLASLTGTASAQAQIVYDSIHNATSIVGTWSSGAQNVMTGPVSFLLQKSGSTSFIWPRVPGFRKSSQYVVHLPSNNRGLLLVVRVFVASFIYRLMFYDCFSTNDGFYEISRYRFNSNGVWKLQHFLDCHALISLPGSNPTCITGVVNWVHGTYTLNPNGSISMIPFGDGFQQVQDPCAAVSNFIETYNDTEYYQSWRIFTDPTTGYHLHLYRFDGAPLNPQFLISTTPNMHPTRLLRNVTVATPPSRRSINSSAENLLGPHWMVAAMTAAAVVLMAI